MHSWNGKYRRPAGLATKDYSEPMKGDLLWIYEGLTEYLGSVLAARSGLETPDLFRDRLAYVAAHLEHESGRAWRPLADTAISAQILFDARDDYAALRRGIDFYGEGQLVWLEVDTLLRKLSHGTKSIDDFCRAFYGGDERAAIGESLHARGRRGRAQPRAAVRLGGVLPRREWTRCNPRAAGGYRERRLEADLQRSSAPEYWNTTEDEDRRSPT